MQNIFELRETKSSKRATFCLPPKCGTTSWQRALSYQVVNHREDYLVPEKAVELLKKHKEGTSSDIIGKPYDFMDHFQKYGVARPSGKVFRP